jgi:hypothetical protein
VHRYNTVVIVTSHDKHSWLGSLTDIVHRRVGIECLELLLAISTAKLACPCLAVGKFM